ncbi:AAA family ATPase [uncultured Mailhella sp.]|uniref:DNA repair protein RecN n=1 Tax=uncultured Mailhella sp. TaxID=1981031 RepID=UPI00262A50BF|nr:AAA family ATPase [uncultured Mailhella sp.]
MLEYLRIRGLGLIDDMELEFGGGMNVLTGETGAGKSFILKAINFVLGEKLNAELVRPGCGKAQVEALFTRTGEAGEEEVILRRELSAASGRSHFFLNGSLTSQDAVRALRPGLLFHVSQHGQQKLLQPSYQAELIDAFLKDPGITAEKDRLLRELKEVRHRREALLARIAALSEKRELLEMQQKEIEKVSPEEGEEERLEQAKTELRQSERLREQYARGLELMLGGEEPGLEPLLGELERLLDSLAREDAGFAPALNALIDFQEETRELTRRFRTIPSTESGINPDALEARLYELSQLKRRLRRSIPDILRLKDEITENLSFLDACGLDLHRLEKRERELACGLHMALQECNAKRAEAAKRFCSALERELAGLGFSEHVRVEPEHTPCELWPPVEDGEKQLCPACIEERWRLLWAPNPGQRPQPLDKIASGGELSRFLLAVVGIRQAGEDATLIFDEVDAGVGGLTLNRVSDRLAALAERRQVLLITHWPQLAVRAARHFHVFKEERDGETFTLCRPLDAQARAAELRRMAGEEDCRDQS